MYRILLVDDEPFILEGLKHIINWDEHGIEIAGQASNGLEAMEILSSTRVDILLTDIRMPKMNGLELIRMAREKDASIHSIVLSGYDDFEYVKEALKLGIENYLLKPVSREELSATLLNTVKKIEKEHHSNINERQGFNIFRENILYRWLSNSIDDAELLEKAQLVNIPLTDEKYAVAILRILCGRRKQADFSASDLNVYSFAVQNICGELAGDTCAITFIDLNGELVLIFSGTAAEDRTKMPVFFRRCIESINEHLGLDVFISVGSPEKGYQSAYKSYLSAKALQSYSLILPRNLVIYDDEIKMASSRRQAKVKLDFEAFEQLIEKEQQEDCIRFIDESFKKMCITKGTTPSFIQDMAVELLYHMSGVLKRHSKNSLDNNGDLDISFSEVYQMQTIEDLTEWLKMTASKTIELLKSIEGSYSPLIKQVLKYIHANLHSAATAGGTNRYEK